MWKTPDKKLHCLSISIGSKTISRAVTQAFSTRTSKKVLQAGRQIGEHYRIVVPSAKMLNNKRTPLIFTGSYYNQ